MVDVADTYDRTTEELLAIARDALRETNNTEGRIDGIALSDVPTVGERSLNHQVMKPDLQSPPEFGDLFSEDPNDDLKRISDEVERWFDQYFPNLNACFKTLPEDWLCAVLDGGDPLGSQRAVYDQVWNDARARARTLQEDELARMRREYSARGFRTPPGAYFSALDRSEQRLNESLREVNTAQAEKEVELKARMLELAVQEASRIKTAMMTSLASITSAVAQANNQGTERARVRAQALSALYSALGQYYNVEVAFEELKLRAEEANLNAQNSADSLKIDAFSARGGVVGAAAGALGQAARAFASIAEGAVGSAGSLVAQVK